MPNRTCTGLARTPDCRAAWLTLVRRLAARTVPGIDKIAAALILIEIGDDMTRFGRTDSLASWAALSPGNKQSAGKRKS